MAILMNYKTPPHVNGLSAEVTHKGHIYHFRDEWQAGWVLTVHCDGVLIEQRLTDAESGKAVLIKALLALEGKAPRYKQK